MKLTKQKAVEEALLLWSWIDEEYKKGHIVAKRDWPNWNWFTTHYRTGFNPTYYSHCPLCFYAIILFRSCDNCPAIIEWKKYSRHLGSADCTGKGSPWYSYIVAEGFKEKQKAIRRMCLLLKRTLKRMEKEDSK